MISEDLTKKMVDDLWAHVCKEFGSKVSSKEDSDFMQLVGEALDAMGIMDQEFFLERYATTIRTTIYVPPGRLDNLLSSVMLCAHENMHVHQWNEGGEGFAGEYLASPARRAFYEAQAMVADMEVYYYLTERLPSFERRASSLKNYNVRDADIRTVVTHLRLAGKDSARNMTRDDNGRFNGVVKTPTGQCVIDFLESYDG